MYQQGITPPINILDSLSRLMKDGIGKGVTRDNHSKISDQIFASYSKVQEVRALAKVLGEADLTPKDKKYLEFGEQFEKRFINQGKYEFRDINQTLDLALELLKILPPEDMDKLVL